MFWSDITAGGNPEQKSIEIDTSKTIRYVQMRIYLNYLFEGLRFSDEDGNTIQEVVWDARPGGDWTPPREIPQGQHIIGIEVNTAEQSSGLINYMDFITGPIPSSEISDLRSRAAP